jgi:hypothetical protein
MEKKMEGKRKERSGKGKEAKKGWRSEGKGKGKIRQAEDVEERTEKDRKRKEKKGKGRKEWGRRRREKERKERSCIHCKSRPSQYELHIPWKELNLFAWGRQSSKLVWYVSTKNFCFSFPEI